MSIRTKLIGIAAAIMTGFFAVFRIKQSERNKIKAETEEAASEYREAGYEAGRVGEAKEREVKNEKADTDISRFN